MAPPLLVMLNSPRSFLVKLMAACAAAATASGFDGAASVAMSRGTTGAMSRIYPTGVTVAEVRTSACVCMCVWGVLWPREGLQRACEDRGGRLWLRGGISIHTCHLPPLLVFYPLA